MARKNHKAKDDSSILFKLMVGAVFLWGILLRAPEVVSGNYLFGFDQGRDYLAAYNIVQNHKLTLIGAEVGAGSAGLSNIFHGPGYYYLLAVMYALFDGDPYGGVLLMFLFGAGTLVLTYLTVKRMFGQTAALSALFLVGVSPLIAPQSRFVWNSHPTSFFIVLALYAVFRIGTNPRLHAPLAVLAAGVIYHFELAISVPLVLSVYLSLPFIYKIKDMRVYLYALGGGIMAFAPAILFEMRHGWKAVLSLWGYVVSHGSGGLSLVRIVDHVHSYVGNAINSFIIADGLLPIWAYNVLCIGLLAALLVFSRTGKDTNKRKFFSFLLLTLVVSYGMFLLLNNSVWDYYLIHAHFIYMYAFAYVIAIGASRRWLMLLGGVFFVSMLVSSYKRITRNWQHDLRDAGGVEKISGKRTAVDYIYTDAKGESFSVCTFMPPVYTYPYDYLFKTYGRNVYGYEPGNEKNGLVYLLIEPDPSKPWTYKGWLETVIVEGDIIGTTVLPTGHIVQKRMFGP